MCGLCLFRALQRGPRELSWELPFLFSFQFGLRHSTRIDEESFNLLGINKCGIFFLIIGYTGLIQG